jgi:hypothetical protein
VKRGLGVILLGRFAVLASSVLVAAVAAAHARPLFPRLSHVVVGSVAFFALMVVGAGCLGLSLLDPRRDWRLVVILPAGYAAIETIANLGAFDFSRARHADLAVVTVAAWVEESTFRRILPRALARQLSDAGETAAHFWAVVASQALFAASHFLPGTVRSAWPDITPAFRLFVGGLLLWMIASRMGLMGAVVTHALLNLGTAFGDAAPLQYPTRAGMLLVCLPALAVLLSESASLLRQPFTSRSHT